MSIEEVEKFHKILQKIAGWSSVLILFVCVIMTLVYFTVKNKNKKKLYKDNPVVNPIKVILFIVMFKIIIMFLGSLIIYYSLKSQYKPEEINEELNKKLYGYSENIVGISILFIIFLIVIFGFLITYHKQMSSYR